jgi:trehalose-6-phosphatase
LIAVTLSLIFVPGLQAGTRGIIEVEIEEDGSTVKYFEIITFDDERFRIDFVGEDRKVTAETPYIMTADGGKTWIMGDKPKDSFYCSQVPTEAFFRNLGDQLTQAVEFFNVKTEAPTVKQVLEEPGPEIVGLKTTHVQLETHARAYAWFLFFKFEYSVKIVEDLWYTTDVEIHPVRKKWINALTQSGNSVIDKLFRDYVEKLPGPILKTESVMDITNIRKNSTKTQKQRTLVIAVEEVDAVKLDELFKLPECEIMDDDEIQEKGKALLSAGKLML